MGYLVEDATEVRFCLIGTAWKGCTKLAAGPGATIHAKVRPTGLAWGFAQPAGTNDLYRWQVVAP
jgi:hypothetical protein